MLFNSFTFIIFFVIVYCLYLVLRHRWQNRMLLVASYVFYGWWDWRFLGLILFSTVLDYICGIKIGAATEDKVRKTFLILSVTGNLFVLGFFKYYDFFADSLRIMLDHVGISIDPLYLNIILPIGISFYTFQTMSYSIDIYRGKMEPTRKFFDFALFVAFFPQLVAGPIERARNLLPQILSPRKLSLNQFYDGCHLIFWGLFQKVLIADNLAQLVDPVFRMGNNAHGIDVLIASYAFAFQIFCDFAGYSNIARGLGKCMGFDIMVNFNLPYFSTNPREFWRRWHISLSSWLRDYLYIPLGGNQKGKLRTYINIAVTMLLGGLWHGAAWTYVTWGMYHGVLIAIHRLFQPYLRLLPVLKSNIAKQAWFAVKVLFFFHLVCLGWIFFRAGSMQEAVSMLRALFSDFSVSAYIFRIEVIVPVVIAILFLLTIQIFQYRRNDLLFILKLHWSIRIAIYFVMYWLLLIYGVGGGKEFIYFQF